MAAVRAGAPKPSFSSLDELTASAAALHLRSDLRSRAQLALDKADTWTEEARR